MKYRSNTTTLKKLCYLFAILMICGAMPVLTQKAEAAKGGVKGKPTDPTPEPEPEPEPKPNPEPEPEPEPTKGGGNSGGGNSGGNSGGGQEIGFSGGKTVYYHLSSLSLSGDMTISGPVVMVIDGDFDIGNNTLEIASTGSLELYIGGSLTMNGRGALNNVGIPANAIIYGTHSESDTTSSITLNGNGAISAVVYAPNVDYISNGGGNSGATIGAVIAENIRFNGNPGPFLYDEALEEIISIFDGYSLTNYKLMKNGTATPSTDMNKIVESSDYDILFPSLFDSK